MMSSLASVLVAKAKAMPEKVVPCVWSATAPRITCSVCKLGAGLGWAYKVDAHDELGLGASLAWGLSHARAVVCCRRAMGSRHWRRRTVAPGTVLAWRGLRRVARWTALRRVAYGLLGVCWVARRAGVDGWELCLVSMEVRIYCSAVYVHTGLVGRPCCCCGARPPCWGANVYEGGRPRLFCGFMGSDELLELLAWGDSDVGRFAPVGVLPPGVLCGA
jgi:hypothetical protein